MTWRATTPTRERMLDGHIITEEWCCLGDCDPLIVECGCGFWLPVCRRCLNGPLCDGEERIGLCRECEWELAPPGSRRSVDLNAGQQEIHPPTDPLSPEEFFNRSSRL